MDEKKKKRSKGTSTTKRKKYKVLPTVLIGIGIVFAFVILSIILVFTTSSKDIKAINSKIEALPVPENSYMVEDLSSDGHTGFTVKYESNHSLKEIEAFYNKNMPSYGWEKRDVSLMPNLYDYKGIKGNTRFAAMVALEEKNSSTLIILFFDKE